MTLSSETELKFCDILEKSYNFQTYIDLKHWKENDELQHVNQCAENFKEINDLAEREVRRLEQDFNCSITKNGEEKQYLLQVLSQVTGSLFQILRKTRDISLKSFYD